MHKKDRVTSVGRAVVGAVSRDYSPVFVLLLSFLFLLTLVPFAKAQDKEGYKGWEIDSKYNKMYNPKDRDSMKGTLVKFTKVTPLPGMATGTAFIFQEGKDEKILVHLCPQAYAKANETGLKKGDRVKVKGSWIEIDGEDVFVASKVKKGDHFQFKVRLTSDGTPFWTMSPEQLKKEMKQ